MEFGRPVAARTYAGFHFINVTVPAEINAWCYYPRHDIRGKTAATASPWLYPLGRYNQGKTIVVIHNCWVDYISGNTFFPSLSYR